jgi:hypothetical protein
MHQITLDWSSISSLPELWDVLLKESNAPTWHGHNLNALRDSWVTGDINPTGPPYAFHFLNSDLISPALVDVAPSVMQIAHTSVQEHGGTCSVA